MNAQQSLEHMQALWGDPHRKNDWLYETAHDLSQLGTLGSHASSLQALSKILGKNAVIDLYYILRNYSMRPESEWREEFLRYFDKTVSEAELPAPMGDEFWLQGIDPATGLPVQHDPKPRPPVRPHTPSKPRGPQK